MAILGRIFIILTAALVVVGATIAFVGNSNSAGFPGAGERPGEPTFVTDAGQDHTAVATRPGDTLPSEQFSGRPHREGHDSPSLFGIVGVFKNLAIIGVIVMLVTLGGRAGKALARFGGRLHNT
jgi:hypothetical protein